MGKGPANLSARGPYSLTTQTWALDVGVSRPYLHPKSECKDREYFLYRGYVNLTLTFVNN